MRYINFMSNCATILDGLSLSEQETLLAELEFRLARRDDFTPEEVDAYELLANLLDHREPMPSFVKNYGKGKYSKNVSYLYRFVDESCDGFLRRSQRNSVARTSLRCLAKRLAEQEIQPTPKTVLNNIHRLPVAVDSCYPYYAKSKMLHRVARIVS